MATRKLYQVLASHLNAIQNCQESGNAEWLEKHTEAVASLVKDFLPSGSGFDAGTLLDFDASKGGTRLHFHTSFHHMDDNGSYDGWSSHDVIIKPCLIFGFDIKVTGRDKREIKEYIAEVFHSALNNALTNESGSYRFAA